VKARYRRATTDVVKLVQSRDFGCCAYCGHGINGERGRDWSLHHRQPAGMGGDRKAHTAANLIMLDGCGVTACHGWVESHRTEATKLGFLVRRPSKPLLTPIEHAMHGLVLLDDEGGFSPADECEGAP
jgi:hypothetical protein